MSQRKSFYPRPK